MEEITIEELIQKINEADKDFIIHVEWGKEEEKNDRDRKQPVSA